MDSRLKEKLEKLRSEISKHSQYQELPDFLKSDLDSTDNRKIKRYEKERFAFISNHIDFNGMRIIDIGGNTGYFSFESIRKGAKKATIIEGNKAHADFVQKVSEVMSFPIEIVNKFIDFKSEIPEYDIMFLLNVLHHIGDDFRSNEITITEAKIEIIEIINSLSKVVDTLVLQIGFNWKGDIKFPLFEKGTKVEMIEFITSGVKDKWEVKSIGIPTIQNKNVVYTLPTIENLKRNDVLGEFLNRPLFILCKR